MNANEARECVVCHQEYMDEANRERLAREAAVTFEEKTKALAASLSRLTRHVDEAIKNAAFTGQTCLPLRFEDWMVAGCLHKDNPQQDHVLIINW